MASFAEWVARLGELTARLRWNQEFPKPKWLTVAQLGDIHQNDIVHQEMRLLEANLYYVSMAQKNGTTVQALMGSDSAGKARSRYWTYLCEANKYRLLKAYAERYHDAPEPIDESAIDHARGYWRRMQWGDPDAEFVQKVQEAEKLPWGTRNRLT